MEKVIMVSVWEVLLHSMLRHIPSVRGRKMDWDPVLFTLTRDE